MDNNPELNQIELGEKMNSSLLKSSIADNLPSIMLTGNYDYQKPYYFTNEWESVESIMVTLNYPIFEGLGLGNYGKIKAAKSNLNSTRFTRDQVEKMIKLGIEKTYLEIIEARERIIAQKENVDTAKENLRIAQERYAKGLVSDIEVKDNQLALTQAEVNYYQALYDYQIAEANLEKQTGGLK